MSRGTGPGSAKTQLKVLVREPQSLKPSARPAPADGPAQPALVVLQPRASAWGPAARLPAATPPRPP